MHPVEKYKKLALDLHAKAQNESRRRVRHELENLARSYALLARKIARISWRRGQEATDEQ
jgi:hypothetical protein